MTFKQVLIIVVEYIISVIIIILDPFFITSNIMGFIITRFGNEAYVWLQPIVSYILLPAILLAIENGIFYIFTKKLIHKI